MNTKYRKRRLINQIALFLCLLSMLFGMLWLVWILLQSMILGVGAMSAEIFTEMTPAPNSEIGGLANALWGTFLLVLGGTLLGAPIGIMTGIYLAEYGKNNWFAEVTRFINDILLSAPSIIIGLFVYAVIVLPTQTFSGWAGIIALALIMLPVVIRTTENMLLLVPNTLREAAFALGVPKWKMVSGIVLKAAKSGITTGILLGIAQISGETAPLLFTSLSNQFWSSDLSQPIASLPITIYRFAMSPFENWQQLAWAGVFLIMLTVLLLNIFARYYVNRENVGK